MSTTYAHVSYPWRAAIDTGSPWPASFYVALVGQALRYGLPASRRPGRLWALAARHGLPERALAAGLRRLPGAARPELDELAISLHQSWTELQAGSAGLPSQPPPLSLLALQRSAGRTAFAFDRSSGALLVVAKTATGPTKGVEREVAALQEARPAGVAPRYLGQAGAWRVQEGLRGAPLIPRPLAADQVRDLEWNGPLAALGEGLCRLAQRTAKTHAPGSVGSRVAAALEHPAVSARAKRVLGAAWGDVQGLSTCVLRHRDTSIQNCLFEDGRLAGIVDWEMAESRGAPSFDVWNAAMSYLDSSIGMVAWSDELALAAFTQAWRHSGLWRGARQAGRSAAGAAGVPEAMRDPLLVVFFGTRIGDHVERPDIRRGTTIRAAIGMLEVVCGD